MMPSLLARLRSALSLAAAPAAALLLWSCSSVPDAPRDAGPPEANRFTKTVLLEALDEPMQLEFDAEGRVYWIERPGAVRRLDPETGEVTLLGTVPTVREGEAGLVGFVLDRSFETTRQLYAYYSAAGREMRVSRFTLGEDGRLDPASEVVLLRWPYDLASHFGGGMTWDAEGNLYVATGDNTDATQYTPIHWTHEGGRGQDAQRTSANTNDLRGKILRIRPQPDGGYEIPEGNLFAPGTPDTRPEIYTMGNRNPWRLSIDSETGILHWGEVGPDAGADSSGIGPRGYDEFNVAREAGNYGWPYFIGYNRAYHTFDYATRQYGPPFDPEHPANPSPNNTGLEQLPPARPAFLAYPYAVSEAFPIMASGGRNAVGGPIFHRANFAPDAARLFPAYYEDKWFVADFVRNWIMVLTMDEARTEVVAMERFLPEVRYSSIIDLDFGPDGDLYVLEYGTEWFRQNPDARLSRIEYNAGNRAPVARITADRTAGAAPLAVALSAAESVDYDGDELDFAWAVTPAGGGAARHFDEAEPALTLDEPGVYTVRLTVTDPSGAASTAELALVAGNEPPSVSIELTEGNRSFFFPGAALAYRVRAEDDEDGRLGEGIDPEEVAVTAEYVPSGVTPQELAAAGDLGAERSVRHLRALAIMAKSDCSVCHTVETASAGPAFRAVAERYAGEEGATAYLAGKILQGGSGVWGEVAMPAHPALTPAEASTLAEYVLSLAGPETGPRRLPVEGRFVASVPGGADGAAGAYVLRASYTDEGANGVAPIAAHDVLLLRAPHLAPETADVISEGITYTPSRDPGFIVAADGAHVAFRGIDLTGIDRIDVHALTRFYTWSHFVGATVEVRLGSPTGRLVGAPVPKPVIATPTNFGEETMEGGDNAPGGPVYLSGEPPASIDASGIEGVHDVFVVFRNEAARPEEPLLILTGVEFVRAGGDASAGTAP